MQVSNVNFSINNSLGSLFYKLRDLWPEAREYTVPSEVETLKTVTEKVDHLAFAMNVRGTLFSVLTGFWVVATGALYLMKPDENAPTDQQEKFQNAKNITLVALAGMTTICFLQAVSYYEDCRCLSLPVAVEQDCEHSHQLSD